MREELVGYLLDALQPEERASVESRLATDPGLKQELEILQRALNLLDCDRDHFDPPQGLAHRTCQFVASQVDTILAPAAPPAKRWRWADFAMAAALFLAASILFFPAMNRQRYAASVTGCKQNLTQLGRALAQYSDAHGGYFPVLQPQGRHPVAGFYAVTLLDQGQLKDPTLIICPASQLAGRLDRFHVPTVNELEQASHEQRIILYQSMGGSYGYNLGYVIEGEYRPTKNLGRKMFAIMADAPAVGGRSHHSTNHGDSGQNVLFEDEHVEFLINSSANHDDIYLNDRGETAAGTHQDDAVIGPSHIRPLRTSSEK